IIENPVTITDSSETIINIFALPTSYEIINTMGLVVKQGSLSQVAPSSSINLTDQLQGIYTLFIYDDNIPESKIDFQILKQ
ncbi:MAG: hypothetical protein RLZZ185_1034, partial [Bacteroidota bacterium]